MNREEALEFIAQSVKSDVDMALVADAIKALKQEPILDKIRAEIDEVYEELDGCDPDSLGTFACRIDDILDKYKADRSVEETETWNGIHAQITAPKGTFDKIFNDTEEDIDDI